MIRVLVCVLVGFLLAVTPVSAGWSASFTQEWTYQDGEMNMLSISILEYRASPSVYVTGLWQRRNQSHKFDIQTTYYLTPQLQILYVSGGVRFQSGQMIPYFSVTLRF